MMRNFSRRAKALVKNLSSSQKGSPDFYYERNAITYGDEAILVAYITEKMRRKKYEGCFKQIKSPLCIRSR